MTSIDSCERPSLLRQLRTAVVLLTFLSILTGCIYPALVTAVAQVLFPAKANGSVLWQDGRAQGSSLIGQQFDDRRYCWGRPSATSPFPYNAGASAGSNLGPTNPALVKGVAARVAALQAANPKNRLAVPVDLVTASASGLDPHISVAAALYQVRRVATARGKDEEQVRGLVWRHVEGRQLGILGEPRVNVLLLNLALDEMP